MPSIVLNFLAKTKYLLKYSNFVPYIITLSFRFVKALSVKFREKKIRKNILCMGFFWFLSRNDTCPQVEYLCTY